MEALRWPDELFITAYLAPYTGATLRGYRATMMEWLVFVVRAHMHILEAGRLHIEQWAKAERQRGLSKTSLGTKLVPICGFYRWAFQEGLTETDVGAFVRRPSRPRRSNLKWLDRGQADRFLDASRQMGRPAAPLVHLLLLNGLRLGETLAARTRDLGHQDGMTTLALPSRKAGVMDVVSLPDETVATLASSGYLIGARLQPHQVYKLMDRLSDVCGIEFQVRPHMLRATFVTLSLDAGVPARDVIASAGWTSAQMLGYYDRAHASIRRNASHRLADYLADPRE